MAVPLVPAPSVRVLTGSIVVSVMRLEDHASVHLKILRKEDFLGAERDTSAPVGARTVQARETGVRSGEGKRSAVGLRLRKQLGIRSAFVSQQERQLLDRCWRQAEMGI
jgi:hypothetical protein